MKKNGFTLIELIVVIAIICILATITIAWLSSARTRAACKAGDARACMEVNDIEMIEKMTEELRKNNKLPVTPVLEKTNLEYAKEICEDGIDRFEGDPDSTFRSELEVRCK